MDKSKDTLNRVKEKVDFIYGITNGVDYKEGFHIFKDRFLGECVTALVKRGILSKTAFYGGGSIGRKYTFRWIATMEPTEILYINIYKDIDEAHKAKQERWKLAKRRQRQKEEMLKLGQSYKGEDCKKEASQEEQEEKQITNIMTLNDFSDEQLWKELKNRGYIIEDNRIVRKQYLD